MRGRVAFNRPIGENFFRMRIVLPGVVGFTPGQFVMVKISGLNDPFLPRPFSVAAVKDNRVDIIYKIVGRGTELLSRREAGTSIVVTGPLGNGFTMPESGDFSVIMVAGGVGLPPLYFLLTSLLDMGYSRKKIYLFYGTKNADSILLYDELKDLRINLFMSTENGSVGHEGVITDLLLDEIGNIPQPAVAYSVGPTPMMAKVVEISRNLKIKTEVSLETMMACGIGVCLGCTVKPKQPYFNKFGYLKVCKNGPVFPGEYFF